MPKSHEIRMQKHEDAKPAVCTMIRRRAARLSGSQTVDSPGRQNARKPDAGVSGRQDARKPDAGVSGWQDARKSDAGVSAILYMKGKNWHILLKGGMALLMCSAACQMVYIILRR